MGTLATNMNPIPKPNARPCERKRCHISLAHDAPSNPAVSKRIPRLSVGLVPNVLTHCVAKGAIINAMEIDNPPMNANSREVAPGKASVDK